MRKLLIQLLCGLSGHNRPLEGTDVGIGIPRFREYRCLDCGKLLAVRDNKNWAIYRSYAHLQRETYD